MEITQEENARITDSKHKIQSIAESLSHVDPRKIPHFDAIEECLQNVDKSLQGALSLQPERDKPKSEKRL